MDVRKPEIGDTFTLTGTVRGVSENGLVFIPTLGWVNPSRSGENFVITIVPKPWELTPGDVCISDKSKVEAVILEVFRGYIYYRYKLPGCCSWVGCSRSIDSFKLEYSKVT